MTSTSRKIVSAQTLARRVAAARASRRKVVLTNGCFDLLHVGHVQLLERAKSLGDVLVVALNSDRSMRVLKGPQRPIVAQRDRARLVAALAAVDYVTIFDQPTPQRLIERLQPDVLVKGADWGSTQIVGRDAVTRRGGQVVRIPLRRGYSTTHLIERIQALR